MLSSKSPLDCRLDLIQLGPLDETSAMNLLAQPLADLGFSIEKPDRLLPEILDLTGRLPNLIHLFGMKLVDRAIRENADTITPEHLDGLKKDFLMAKFFTKSLDELEDPMVKLVALCLLDLNKSGFTLQEVQATAKRQGLNLDTKKTNEICIDLVINNVLVWDNGTYRIANGGLGYYARQQDYFTSTLNEAHAAAMLPYGNMARAV